MPATFQVTVMLPLTVEEVLCEVRANGPAAAETCSSKPSALYPPPTVWLSRTVQPKFKSRATEGSFSPRLVVLSNMSLRDGNKRFGFDDGEKDLNKGANVEDELGAPCGPRSNCSQV